MKQRLLIALVVILMSPMGLLAQTYQSLWKQVEEAQKKDLPKTAITHLQKIENKARKERAYGQLLKSTLLHARLQSEVAPDSLRPAVERLELLEKQAATDIPLQSVYATVLAQVYENNPQFCDDWSSKHLQYRNRAMAHPEALAAVKADTYAPFVIKGEDSQLYSHDLLSVVGSELNAWQWLSDYYTQTGNRPAACLTALKAVENRSQDLKEHLAALDSLIATYGDLPEACEVAISRYELMYDETPAKRAEWLQESLRRWGNWRRANVLRNDWTALTNPSFEVSAEQQVTEINKSQTIRFSRLCHLQSLTMRVFKTRLEGDTELNPENNEDYKKIKPGLTELTEHRHTLTFSGHEDYDQFEDSLQLNGLPAGVYMLEFSTQPHTEVWRELYFVSGVRLLMQSQPTQQTRYIVVDATTGQPLGGATIRLGFRQSWNKPLTHKTLTCDAQGEAIYKNSGNSRPVKVMAYTANDKFCPEMNGSGTYSYYDRKFNNEHTTLFTDRSIYRPGQTIHVAAIVWREISAIDNTAVANKSIKLELRDANYKIVGEKQLTTDRFGKCSTEFTLPTGLLNGIFTLRGNGTSTSIRVEEYKRPTFQVEFPEYKESYQQGDTVHAQARATTYAGVPVQGARVHYVVKRRVAFWWMSYSWYWQGGLTGKGLHEDIVGEGDTMTGDDGTFNIDMPMVLPKGLGTHPMFYNFVAEADVTDVAGETHSGTLSLPLGSKSTALTCDLPQQVRSDKLPKVTFTRRNAAGKEINGMVKYRLDNGKWQQCSANAPYSIFNTQCKSGEHHLLAVCEQDTVDMKFIVFGLDDKKPATQTDDWFYVSHRQFTTDGTPVTVQVGASDPNLHIVYSIFADDRMLESGAVKRNSELINRKFTYKEDYGNGLLITYAWVKNGKTHVHQTTITRPLPDKQLKLTWETFRNRLTPGQQEEWRLKITKPDGTPADASLMAVLYDKSLDHLYPHQWNFAPTTPLPMPSVSWMYRQPNGFHGYGAQSFKHLSVTDFNYSHFDGSIYPYYNYFAGRRHAMLLTKAAPTMAAVAESAASNDEAVLFDMADVAASKASMNGANASLRAKGATVQAEEAQIENVMNNEPKQQVQLRENLQETAFCYPAIETDTNGQVTLKFTLPESLTTWRFMGISNTTDMLYGSIESEAVAQKDIMVQPNVPRFIRIGDQAQLSTRIFNISEKTISGTAQLTLIDAETEHTILEQSAPFSVNASQTTNITFDIDTGDSALSGTSLLICKVVALGEGFSDGEQHYIPVLPDCEMATKTIPITQHKPGTQAIDLTKLFPIGTTQQKLTIEYTNNPTWFMVQSLPVLGQPWEHSAIEQAASYYSNLLARTLLKQSPQAKNAFEQWKRESTHEQTLQSQLQKNQELKDIVLSETPWVSAADREAEQKQQLADFFDENGISNRLSISVEKLQELQNSDGSFSWYSGMPGSTTVTVAVSEMLARLNIMAGLSNDMKQMQAKAFNYTGKEMVELVNELKKNEKKGNKPSFPSFTALRWLYICAIGGGQLSAAMKSANDYLIALLKKDIKRQSIYEKALTAIVLAKHNEIKQAQQYIQSLKEYSVYSDEMGRYYDTPRALYSWYNYKIPTEVAALEAIQLVSPKDNQIIDEMRCWLLQEKRTQVWDTPISSTNAIWAFLNGKPESLDASQNQVQLTIDGSSIEQPKATAGLGYVKIAISQPQGHTFTATKISEGTSWGAVYAQFMQKTSEVEASQSGITVRREFLLSNLDNSNGMTPDKHTIMQVGQRLRVRIIIDTERDLDFVQVVDRRAACMEPVRQLSGYQNGAYVSPKDNATHYYYYGLGKGHHIIETEYYIDRAGSYETGTCTVQCAYAPEFRATVPSTTLKVKE